MKQLFVILLILGVSFCDKLDRKYLPGKPDPFNNGGISDSVLKSATPSFSGPSGNFGSSTNSASNKYLPPSYPFSAGKQEVGEHSGAGANNFGSTSGSGASGHFGSSLSNGGISANYPVGSNQYSSGSSGPVGHSAVGISANHFTSGSAHSGQHSVGSLHKSVAGSLGNEVGGNNGQGATVSDTRGGVSSNDVAPSSVYSGQHSVASLHKSNTGFAGSVGNGFGGSYGQGVAVSDTGASSSGTLGKFSEADKHGVDGSFSGSSNVAGGAGSSFAVSTTGYYGAAGKNSAVSQHGVAAGIGGSFGVEADKSYDVGSNTGAGAYGTIGKISEQGKLGAGAGSVIGAGSGFNTAKSGVGVGPSTGIGAGTYDNHSGFGTYPTGTVGSSVPYNRNTAAHSEQYNLNNQINTIRYDNNPNAGDGSYNYQYETENGIHAEENGSGDDSSKTTRGGYSYISPEGEKISIEYVADGEGYHPVGSHVPEIPEAILKSIELNKAEEASGVYQEGSYTDDDSGKYQGDAAYEGGAESGSLHHSGYQKKTFSNTGNSFPSKVSQSGETKISSYAGSQNNGFNYGGYASKHSSESDVSTNGFSGSAGHNGGPSFANNGFQSGGYGDKQFSVSSSKKADSGSSLSNNKASAVHGANQHSSGQPLGNIALNRGSVSGGHSTFDSSATSGYNAGAPVQKGHSNLAYNYLGQHSSNPQHYRDNARQQGAQGGNSGYSYGPGVGSQGSDDRPSSFSGYSNEQKTTFGGVTSGYTSGSQDLGHHSTFSGSSTTKDAAPGSSVDGTAYTSGQQSGSIGHISQGAGHQSSFSGAVVTGSSKGGLAHGGGHQVGYGSQSAGQQLSFSGLSTGQQPTFGGAVSESVKGGFHATAPGNGPVQHGTTGAGYQSSLTGSTTIKSGSAFGSQGSVGLGNQGALPVAGQHSTYFDEKEGYKY